MKLHLDFETQSDLDIWDVGAWAYAAHPSTSILCMAYALDDGPITVTTPLEMAEWVTRLGAMDVTVCAHNSFFERCIWHHQIHKKLGFPDIPADKWDCTLARSAVMGLPKGLAKVAIALNLKNKKDETGRRIMLRCCKGKHDVSEADMRELKKYCAQDIAVERELDEVLAPLSDIERKVWLLDQQINWRGIEIDKEAVTRAIALTEEHSKLLTEELVRITAGEIDTGSQVKRIREWLKSEWDIDVPDITKETVTKLLADPATPPVARRVIAIRMQLARSSVSKYLAMRDSLQDDTRIRDTLQYHAAATGRWGGKGVQFQNLPRGTEKDTDQVVEAMKTGDLPFFKLCYPDVTSSLSSAIRGMIIASPGKKLIVADYSAIEARVVMWLAGEQRGLQKWRAGVDLYKDMASIIYSKPVAEIDKNQRTLGKTAVLGCGYGMGPDKFLAICQGYGIPEMTPEDKYDFRGEDLARIAVSAYRAEYAGVVKYWYAIEQKVRMAILGRPRDDRTSDPRYKHYVGKWEMNKKFLTCTLPSGRLLWYYMPDIRDMPEKKERVTYMAVDSQTKQFTRVSTYGGSLVENITQAVARDILAAAMLRLEAAGYHIVLTVHDEIVCETARGTVEEFKRIMCELPEWAKGCPITAEGWEGVRYRK
jgi:DNA polymerase bacteriophage-type